MMKTLLFAASFALLTLAFPSTAWADEIEGSNAFTRYRLPWQHGDAYHMTQGYNEMNPSHGSWDGKEYSLDFDMNTGTRVVAMTQGSTCRVPEPNTTGLGLYLVQTAPAAPGHTATSTDYYFYAHLSQSWLPTCSSPTTQHIGQIIGLSGASGNVTGPHLHITVQNPGSTCYCGSAESVKFPPLSGIDFDGVSGGTSDSYVSDSVMPGDDNTKPQPNWTQKIFDAWNFNGGVDGMGVPWDAAGAGPGVHQWANGVVQDFANQWGTTGIIMLKNGAQYAHGVYGDIFLEYLDQGGASAWMGYPTSGEYTDINGIARRSDFEGGFICWQAGNTWVVDWDVRWWC